MFCGSCGQKMTDSMRFCQNCGAPVAGALVPGEAPSPAAAPPSPYEAPPPPPPPPPPQIAPYPGPFAGTPAPVGAGSAPLSMGQYLGMLILLSIPVLNLILLLMWAFGGNVNPSKKNLAKALLVMMLIFAGLALVFNMGLLGVIRQGL